MDKIDGADCVNAWYYQLGNWLVDLELWGFLNGLTIKITPFSSHFSINSTANWPPDKRFYRQVPKSPKILLWDRWT